MIGLSFSLVNFLLPESPMLYSMDRYSKEKVTSAQVTSAMFVEGE